MAQVFRLNISRLDGPDLLGPLPEIGETNREQFIAHWLLSFIEIDYRIWSGDGILTYENNDYYGAGQFMDLSRAELQIDQPNHRLLATLAAGNDTIKRLFIASTSIYVVEVNWIVSVDGGIYFQNTGRRFRGRTNAPTYSNGIYSVEIEPTLSDQFRKRPRTWSDEDQRERYPDDKGFIYASQLVDGTKRQRWPQ